MGCAHPGGTSLVQILATRGATVPTHEQSESQANELARIRENQNVGTTDSLKLGYLYRSKGTVDVPIKYYWMSLS